jgi:hypothetical protein
MNKFFMWLQRKLDSATMSDRPHPVSVNEIRTSNRPVTDGMNVNVWAATGGHIVEFRKYDEFKDRNSSKMYIISADQNFSESLTRIISMEMLR